MGDLQSARQTGDSAPRVATWAELGLAIRTPRIDLIPQLVRAAEKLGYSSVWFPDSPRFPDIFVSLAVAAGAATQIALGCAVSNLETRDPTTIASAIASLGALRPGSVLFGLGRGHSAVLMIGRKPTSLDRFATRFELVKTLVGGGTVDLGQAPFRLASARIGEVRLLIAGDSVRTRHLAGSIGDGAIVNVGAVPDLLSAAISEVQAGAVATGKNPMNPVFAWCRAAVASDEIRAVEKLRVHFGSSLMRDAERILRTAPTEPSHATLRRLTIVGSPAECRQRVEELAGVRGVASLIVAIADDDPLRGATLFAGAVLG